MPKQVAVFAGSFKPPHRNHLFIILKALRYMNKNTSEKYIEKPRLYIFISSKTREPCSSITKEVSKEIWNMYISLLPVKYHSQITIVLSNLPSPTQTAYGFVKNRVSKKDIVYFVSDTIDTRYNSIIALCKKRNIQYIPISHTFKTPIYSSNIQQYIVDNKKTLLYKLLPPKLNNVQKNTIYKKLSTLCNR